MSKTLVAYFSASGTTWRVAQKLADAIGADLFEIAPKVPYTTSDLNWRDKNSRTTLEKADESARPALARTPGDLSAYDTVFVGFPVWWYVEPRIVDTFLESCDLAGKAIVPFATSGGSGLGQAPKRMQTIAPGARVLSGKVLNSNPSTDSLRTWAESL
jgi:putative NADPH-quinone reductase